MKGRFFKHPLLQEDFIYNKLNAIAPNSIFVVLSSFNR